MYKKIVEKNISGQPVPKFYLFLLFIIDLWDLIGCLFVIYLFMWFDSELLTPVIDLQAFYLPWAMLALDVIFGSPIAPDLCGILAGHLYYFLTVLHPLAGGKNILQTPMWLYPFCNVLTFRLNMNLSFRYLPPLVVEKWVVGWVTWPNYIIFGICWNGPGWVDPKTLFCPKFKFLYK